MRLRLVKGSTTPLLSIDHPDAARNKYGFEGGRVIALDGVIHLFTSEMVDDPIWVKMKLGHWTSPRGNDDWHRVATVRESSGDFTGSDSRAALWSPMPIYDCERDSWNLFYVAYKCQPNTAAQFLNNTEGRIWRAVSRNGGIEGPYDDIGVIMQPDEDSGDWEGLQGVDSFFPFQVKDHWYAFYGSAKTEKLPIEDWLVGWAVADQIGGPWKRDHSKSPVPIEPVFIENPVVQPLRDKLWIALYDTQIPNAIGYSISVNGVDWGPGQALTIQEPKAWADHVRTPLGLVQQPDGHYHLYYTGYRNQVPGSGWDSIVPTGDGAIGRVLVELED